jgi:N-acetylglucosamine-6-phosphate deacetylase
MRLGVEAALVDGALVPGDVDVADGVVSAYGLAGLNGRGVAVPGFVDLQVNGFVGVDLMGADADGYARAGEAMLETGVTAYLPTFISAPEADLLAALRAVPVRALSPRILGVHLEGPFLSKKRLGIHPPSARRDPDPAFLERLLAAGPVRLVTLAPELPGAAELIDLLLLRGVAVSAGHTDATAEQAGEAFERGVRSVTHLFNAMRPFGHRDPGLAGAALADGAVVVQLIADGVHLAPDTVALSWKAAAGRLALVSDAIAAAGMGDGDWRLGTVEVAVRDGVARRPGGTLAGSVEPLIRGVRSLVELGVQLPAAIDAASRVPADLIGRADLGRIAPGARADLVVLDDRLEVQRVLLGGAAFEE